jgi:hypothetical protein
VPGDEFVVEFVGAGSVVNPVVTVATGPAMGGSPGGAEPSVVVTGSPVVGSVVISGATGLVLIPKGSVVWNSCVGTVGAGAAFG